MSEDQIRRKGSYVKARQQDTTSSNLRRVIKLDASTAPTRTKKKRFNKDVAQRRAVAEAQAAILLANAKHPPAVETFETLLQHNFRSYTSYDGKMDRKIGGGIPTFLRLAIEEAARRMDISMIEVVRRMCLPLVKNG